MSDINFLANKKNNSKKRRGKSKTREIEWTKPDEDESSSVKAPKDKPPFAKAAEDKPVSSGDMADKSGKFKFFDWLSFFKNNNNAETRRGVSLRRQEALKPVDKHNKNESAAAREDEGKKNKSRGFSLWKKKSPPVEKISEKEIEKPVKKELSAKGNGKKTVNKENKKKWEKAEILETNLIKGELASFFNWKKGILILTVYSALSGLAVAGFYSGLLLWEQQIKNNRSEDSSRIRDLNEQVIRPLEEDAKKILAEQEKIRLAGDLLRKHIYWTNFFKFLEDNTLSEVYYTSDFSGNTGGKYSFAARTKNFKTILDQVNTMRMNDNIEEATVGGGSVKPASKDGQENGEGDIGGVNFKLELSINQDIFIK